jgi:group II intron reverse transcriptase/maturase
LPSRRKYIPKADGRQRPLGIAAIEDKIVQAAVVTILTPVYEAEFLGFSYGFRPGRCQHDALDALAYGIRARKINWILDADIRSFFDTISPEWLVRFIEHRIGDRRIIRLIQKWLKAGVLEGDQWIQTIEGTPQGAVASPLLANLYLHYVYDLWVQQWRKRRATGDMIVVRLGTLGSARGAASNRRSYRERCTVNPCPMRVALLSLIVRNARVLQRPVKGSGSPDGAPTAFKIQSCGGLRILLNNVKSIVTV